MGSRARIPGRPGLICGGFRGDYGLGWESLIGDFLKFLLNLPPVGQVVGVVGDV